MKIAVIGYVCKPDAGTEPGISWQWALTYARMGIDTTLITHASQRPMVDPHATAAGIRVVYVGDQSRMPEHPKSVLSLASMRLMYGSWLANVESVLCLEPWDLVQHVSWGTIRVQSPVLGLGRRGVWGPLGGGHAADLREIPPGGLPLELVRNASVRVARASMGFRGDVRRSEAHLLVTNEETALFANKVGASHVGYEFADGVQENRLVGAPRTGRLPGPLKLLWAGRVVSSKRPDIAVRLLATLRGEGIDSVLKLVGEGPYLGQVQKLAKKFGVDSHLDLPGRLPWESVWECYDDSDAYVFCSARDSSAPGILEAAARGVPTLAIRAQGVEALVPQLVARGPKRKGGARASSVEDLARYGRELLDDAVYAEASSAALAFAKRQVWEEKVQRVFTRLGVSHASGISS